MLVHQVARAATVAIRRTVQVVPEELATWHCTFRNQLFEAKVHRAYDFMEFYVFVEQLEQEAIGGEGPLNGQPELLFYRTDIVTGRDSLRFDVFAIELSLDEGVDCSKSVHLGELFGLNETDLELFEFFLDLCGHKHYISSGVRARLVVELDLLVTGALHRDTDLKVSGDLGEVIALGVEHGDPLVLDGMLILEVD